MMRFLILLVAAILLPGLPGMKAGAEELQVLPLQRLSLPARDLIPEPEAATNRPGWKSSASLGFSMTRGNSDTLLLIGKLQTERRSGMNEWLLGSSGAYGEDNSTKNRETLVGYAQYNHFLAHSFYDFGRVDGLHDGIKDIQYRFTTSIGVGYYLVQQTNLALSVEAGPSAVSERQGGQVETYGAGRLAERIEYRLESGARIWHRAELIPQVDQMANYVVNAELGIEMGIARDLTLQIYLQDNFVNQPAQGYEHNDIRLISGLSYKF
jgi:putative salt-induced outer membrane protein YdiY